MEVLSQVQNLVMEHAFTIGIGLLVVALVAAIAWYWMSRGAAVSKSPVLENQARVNTADLTDHADSHAHNVDVPVSALSPEPHAAQDDSEQTE